MPNIAAPVIVNCHNPVDPKLEIRRAQIGGCNAGVDVSGDLGRIKTPKPLRCIARLLALQRGECFGEHGRAQRCFETGAIADWAAVCVNALKLRYRNACWLTADD